MKALTVRQPWGWAVLAAGADVLTVTDKGYRALLDEHGHLPRTIALHASSQLAGREESAHIDVLTDDARPAIGAPRQVAADAAGFIGLIYPVGTHQSVACLRTCSRWGFLTGWHIELAPKRITLAHKVPAPGAGVQRLDTTITRAILKEAMP